MSDKKAVPTSVRQTHLAWMEERCPAGAYAMMMGRESESGKDADRGSAIHDFAARYIEHLIRYSRMTDWDTGEDLAEEILAEWALPLKQHNDAQEQMRTFIDQFVLEEGLQYFPERQLSTTLSVGQHDIEHTGTIDITAIDNTLHKAKVTDIKSAYKVKPASSTANDFQLNDYAMLVLQNSGTIMLDDLKVEEAKVEWYYTRYGAFVPGGKDDEVLISQEDAAKFKQHLEQRLEHVLFGAGKNEFVPGLWCQYCPRQKPNDCVRWRKYSGTQPPPVRTEKEARRVAGRIIANEQERARLIDALQEYVNTCAPVRVGDTSEAEEFAYWPTRSKEVDADGLLELIEGPEVKGAVGEVDKDDLFKVNKRSKTWKMLEKLPELEDSLEDLITEKVSTRFLHKKVEEG